jgi:hypothetical protein
MDAACDAPALESARPLARKEKEKKEKKKKVAHQQLSASSLASRTRLAADMLY